MFSVEGIKTPLVVNKHKDGSLSFRRQSVDLLVEYAVQYPRTAISNQDTGRYAVASPKGFESETDMPDAEIILIRPTSPQAIIEIVPTCVDVPKIGLEAEDSVDALETVFELYPEVKSVPSERFSEIQTEDD